ncbi:hypothetical protein CYLTODRAFT_460289, partial [Cylindrobasidium torrendii FP15055 ss-10]
KWAVRTIVGLLPTLLHLALALFLIGLVVFLSPLQCGIAISVGIISGALFVAYIASIVIAIVHVESPYRTTFSDILSTTLRWMFNTVYPVFQARLKLPEVSLMPTTRDAEKASAVCLEEHPGATQACHALLWLHNTTGSMSAKTLIMNSLGAFPPKFFHGDAQQEVFVQLSNGCGPEYSVMRQWRRDFPKSTVHDFEQMLRILCHSKYAGDVFLNVDNVEDHLKSDTGLALACAASEAAPSSQNQENAAEEGCRAKLTALLTFFSDRASTILSRLPLDHGDSPDESYASIIGSLGTAPTVVWSSLIRESPWLTRLSPRDLDDWPLREVDLRAYLWLIKMAQKHRTPQSPSVFQNPVSLLAFLHPIFENLGWYDLSPLALTIFTESVPPPLDNEDDGDLMVNSPPPDKDAVREPAIYPPEWPPLPAPTWTEVLKEAEIKAWEWVMGGEARWKAWEWEMKGEARWKTWKAAEEARRKAEIAQEEEDEEKAKREREGAEGGLWNGVRKFVREKLRGGQKGGDESTKV